MLKPYSGLYVYALKLFFLIFLFLTLNNFKWPWADTHGLSQGQGRAIVSYS